MHPSPSSTFFVAAAEAAEHVALGLLSFQALVRVASRRCKPAIRAHHSTGTAHVLSRTRLRGTLAEVRELFSATSDDEAFAQHLNLASTLQLATLSPQAGLRWTLLASKCPPLVRHRDLVYVEYMDSFVTEDGRQGFARAMHSVAVQGPSAEDCIRATLLPSGYVFVETDTPGVLEATLKLEIDFHGRMPRWLLQAGLHARVRHLPKLNDVLLNMRQQRLRLSQRNKCHRCAHSTGTNADDKASRRLAQYTCTACLELFCEDCVSPECETCIGCSLNVYSPGHVRDSILDDTAFRNHARSVDLTFLQRSHSTTASADDMNDTSSRVRLSPSRSMP